MPGGDGTGPVGMGPMTGKRFGYCAGTDLPGYAPFGFGNDLRCRRFGRGQWFAGMAGRDFNGRVNPAWRNRYRYAAPFMPEINPDMKPSGLREQAERLEEMLNGIRKRMDVLATRPQGGS